MMLSGQTPAAARSSNHAVKKENLQARLVMDWNESVLMWNLPATNVLFLQLGGQDKAH